jgi:SAM-dependent methyltransferase
MRLTLKALAAISILLLTPASMTPQSGNTGVDATAAVWDEVFRRIAAPEISSKTSFTAYCVERLLREERLQPGDSAMVLAMGDGRNALYLADVGLKVTGIDISAVGLAKARSAAAETGLEVEAIEADLFEYDLGRESWDLVTNVYFNPAIFALDRIKAAVRPGGFLLIEGYGSDYTGTGPAAETRYRPNQLLWELVDWRILEYQDGLFPSDWADQSTAPVVRILAQKNP